jgi:hexosaminidase
LRTVSGVTTEYKLSNGTFAHKIFPAAQLEVYNHQDRPLQVLGTITSSRLSFETVLIPSSSSSSNRHDKAAIDEVLQPAIQRFQKSLTRYPDFADDYPVNPTHATLHTLTGVKIHIKSSNTRLYHGVSEDYDLTIPDDDSTIVLKATTVFGAMHGLETLGQLLEFGWLSSLPSSLFTASPSATFCIHDIPLYISDAPSFPYRGLMIDTARHYLPLNLILDNLNAMAMNKLNVLHWHLSDSQSFSFATKSYPELAEKGAYHPKRIYTVENVKNVIHQAYLRGIRVIPEIDMPGHTAAIAKSHPEVMAQCPNSGEPMNPTVPETYEFVETIYQDLKDAFDDEFVHVGGDEVWMSEKCWLNDTRIAKWMKNHHMNETVQLYGYFETNLLKTVAKLQKTPIVWQEVFTLNLTITPNTIVDVWKGFDVYTIQNATNQNYRVILSGCWYLDWLDHTWQNFYTCDPRNYTGNKDLMLGGHASMWGEHVDPSNFISRVWPRASAAAERLWTGDVSHGPADNIAERIHKFRCHMVLQGFAAGPTAPGCCPKEVPYNSMR